MNRTIIININGIVFHIEEDAYEVLRSYMIDVKKHFANTEGSNEIVGDIENRIAEMFSERVITGKKEVITMLDVNEVCAQMGKVSDFDIDPDQEEKTREESFYETGSTDTRKLFRDPDDKVFGGVCSGLGHYLDIEALWIRLAMVLLFIVAGTGFLIYIILWIVVPKAKTRADRMAMRGEAPNLQNFKRNFEEEMEGLRGNFTMAGERIKPGLNRMGDGLEQLFVLIGKAFKGLFKVLGVFIIFMLCVSLVALLFCILTFGFWSDGISGLGPEGPTWFIDGQYLTGGLIAAFLVVAIPLVALISLAVRIIFHRSFIGNYVAFTLLIVWLTAAGFIGYYGVKTAEDFAEDATVVQERMLSPYPQYYLEVNDVNMIKKIDTMSKDLDSISTIIRLNKRKGKFKNMRSIDINIIKAETGTQAKLIQEYRASGRDFDVAAKRAERMRYEMNQHEQHLTFDSHATLPKGELMRDQEVNIKMLLPVGCKLYISNESDRYIRNLPTWQCRDLYPESERDGYTEWMMTEDGLKCTAIEREELEEKEKNKDTVLDADSVIGEKVK